MEFQDAKDKVSDIPGRRFDWDTKLWIVPATVQNAERVLKTLRPECDPEIIQWIKEAKGGAEESLTTELPDDAADLLVPWATKRMPWQPEYVNDEKYDGLLDYQRAAVSAMAASTRAILADDMGLGKTFEAISAVEEFALRNGQIDGPKLVVAPNSVLGGWAREISRWLEDAPHQIVDAKSPAARSKQLEAAIEESAWTIVNWEQLRVKKEKVLLKNGGRKTVTMLKEPLFEDTEWLATIADEVHRAKNRKSQQTQGLWRVKGQMMLGLTGTPLMNSPDELWSILRWLWPDEYGNSTPRSAKNPAGHPRVAYWAFYEDYVDYWEDQYKRKVVTGVKNPDALRFVLRGKLIRRTAAILGLKGRKRIRYEVDLNPKQRKLYDEAEKVMWLEVKKDAAAGDTTALQIEQAVDPVGMLYNIPNGAARMIRCQQILENPAILGGEDDSALMDDFEQKFIDSRPTQWVVACKFKESCNILAARLRSKYNADVGVYTGDTPPEDRTKMEDAFQRGELDVIVGTLDATKEGITLTSGHSMYQLTRAWVPATNEQWESRCDRLGQQELVRIYIPLPRNTVSTNNVEPTNTLKEGIVKTVIPKDEIKEGAA
jgi:SNF2 family DNA or RNA helicase